MKFPDPLFILISATALITLWVITFDKMGITNLKMDQLQEFGLEL